MRIYNLRTNLAGICGTLDALHREVLLAVSFNPKAKDTRNDIVIPDGNGKRDLFSFANRTKRPTICGERRTVKSLHITNPCDGYIESPLDEANDTCRGSHWLRCAN